MVANRLDLWWRFELRFRVIFFIGITGTVVILFRAVDVLGKSVSKHADDTFSVLGCYMSTLLPQVFHGRVCAIFILTVGRVAFDLSLETGRIVLLDLLGLH